MKKEIFGSLLGIALMSSVAMAQSTTNSTNPKQSGDSTATTTGQRKAKDGARQANKPGGSGARASQPGRASKGAEAGNATQAAPTSSASKSQQSQPAKKDGKQ